MVSTRSVVRQTLLDLGVPFLDGERVIYDRYDEKNNKGKTHQQYRDEQQISGSSLNQPLGEHQCHINTRAMHYAEPAKNAEILARLICSSLRQHSAHVGLVGVDIATLENHVNVSAVKKADGLYLLDSTHQIAKHLCMEVKTIQVKMSGQANFQL